MSGPREAPPRARRRAGRPTAARRAARPVRALRARPAPGASGGQGYLLSLIARVMIFAIAALSLDLILGFGALVSFGHAAFLGIGAYAVGILAGHGLDEAVGAAAGRARRIGSSRS